VIPFLKHNPHSFSFLAFVVGPLLPAKNLWMTQLVVVFFGIVFLPFFFCFIDGRHATQHPLLTILCFFFFFFCFVVFLVLSLCMSVVFFLPPDFFFLSPYSAVFRSSPSHNSCATFIGAPPPGFTFPDMRPCLPHLERTPPKNHTVSSCSVHLLSFFLSCILVDGGFLFSPPGHKTFRFPNPLVNLPLFCFPR